MFGFLCVKIKKIISIIAVAVYFPHKFFGLYGLYLHNSCNCIRHCEFFVIVPQNVESANIEWVNSRLFLHHFCYCILGGVVVIYKNDIAYKCKQTINKIVPLLNYREVLLMNHVHFLVFQ